MKFKNFICHNTIHLNNLLQKKYSMIRLYKSYSSSPKLSPKLEKHN